MIATLHHGRMSCFNYILVNSMQPDEHPIFGVCSTNNIMSNFNFIQCCCGSVRTSGIRFVYYQSLQAGIDGEIFFSAKGTYFGAKFHEKGTTLNILSHFAQSQHLATFLTHF
jgi:hypothetical protein